MCIDSPNCNYENIIECSVFLWLKYSLTAGLRFCYKKLKATDPRLAKLDVENGCPFPKLLRSSRQNILVGSLTNVCFLLEEAAARGKILSTRKANFRLWLTLHLLGHFYGKGCVNFSSVPVKYLTLREL